MSMSETLERIYPKMISQENELDYSSYELHIERYNFAAQFVKKGDNILDMACGAGYGSHYIAEHCPDITITGVDISESAIDYAQRNYVQTNIKFVQGDIIDYQVATPADVIISLETVEHLEKPELFIAHVNKLLKVDGLFIMSVPITPSLDFNAFHLQDFTESSILKLLQEYGFELLDKHHQVQVISLSKLFLKKNDRINVSNMGLLSYYKKNPTYIFTRIKAILQHGFTNKYITLVLKRT